VDSNSCLTMNCLNNMTTANENIGDVEIPLTETGITPLLPEIKQPLLKADNAELPPWMVKMVRRQDFLNRRYERAHNQFAKAYNDFLFAIDDINSESDTKFTFKQAVEEFQGHIADEGAVEEDDDNDED